MALEIAGGLQAFLIVKSAAYVTYAISLDDTTSVLLIFMLVIAALIVVIVQPFKEEDNIFNMLSTNVLLVMALICAFVAQYDASPVKRHGSFIIIGPFVLALLPLIYIMGIVIHHFYKRWCYTLLAGEERGRVLVTWTTSMLPLQSILTTISLLCVCL